MIDRYTRPEMGAIWTDENRYKAWLEVEILARFLKKMYKKSEKMHHLMLHVF